MKPTARNGTVIMDEVLNRIKKYLPFSILFFLTIVFFSPILFHGRTFFAFDTLFDYLPWSSLTSMDYRPQNTLITDPVNIYYPYYHFLKSSFSRFTLPFWNPNNLCGIPITPPSNPLAILIYLFLPLTTAHDLLLWLHLFLTGVLTYLYLKEIGLRMIPSLIGAVSWMFNGYVMVWFEFEHILLLAPSFPASLYFVERWFKYRSFRDIFLFSLAISYAISSNYAHLIIYQLLLTATYTLYRIFQLEGARFSYIFRDRKNMAGGAICIFLILLTSSSFLLSHLAILDETPQRKPYGFDELYRYTGKVHKSYLITLIFPNFFGSPTSPNNFPPAYKNPQPYNNYNELCLYSGIVTLFLAIAAIVTSFRKAPTGFFFLSAVIALAMAMGSILYYPLARYIPGLNLSTPTRTLYIFGFSVSILSALGANLLLSGEKKNNGFILGAWGIITVAAVGLFFYVQTDAGKAWLLDVIPYIEPDQLKKVLDKHLTPGSAILIQPISYIVVTLTSLTAVLLIRKSSSKKFFFSLALLTLVLDLMFYGRHYNTASPTELAFPETEAISFLKSDKSLYRIMSFGPFLHNGFAPYNIHDIGGYSSFYPKRYGEYINLTQMVSGKQSNKGGNRWVSFETFGSPLLDLLNVKYLLTPPKVTLADPQMELIYDKEIYIYQNTKVMPRIFFVTGRKVFSEYSADINILEKLKTIDFTQTVLLESQSVDQKHNSPRPFQQGNVYKIFNIDYLPDKIEFDISTDARGFLVISDNYHPGWKAYVDDRPTEVMKANYIMRAISVEQGAHHVKMVFQPSLRRLGIVMTYLGWVLFILVWLTFRFLKNPGHRVGTFLDCKRLW